MDADVTTVHYEITEEKIRLERMFTNLKNQTLSIIFTREIQGETTVVDLTFIISIGVPSNFSFQVDHLLHPNPT